jgi:hypothetical protein
MDLAAGLNATGVELTTPRELSFLWIVCIISGYTQVCKG